MTGRRKKKFESIKTVLLYVALIFMAFIMLIPFAWMISASLKLEKDVFSFPIVWIPEDPQWSNYKEIWQKVPLLTGFFNSIKLTVVVTVLQFITSALAAYAFAKLEFKGKNVLFIMTLATMMIPFQVIMVPLFMEVYKMGMYDTYAGLIIPKLASAMSVFMMRAAFTTLPKELEEAARIDGISEFGLFWKVMLPLVKPTMVTLIILGVNGAWNDLLWPLLITSSTDMRTLTNGLALFVGENTIQYGAAFAGAFISILPMFILYLVGQKYFVEGTATSGLKG